MVNISFSAQEVCKYSIKSDNGSEIKKPQSKELLEPAGLKDAYLLEGFNKTLPKLKKDKLENILAYILTVKAKAENLTKTLKECVNADIICNRGVLIDLGVGMSNENKVFRAVRHLDVTFLLQGDDPNKERTDFSSKVLYSGLKLEQLATEPDPSERATKDEQNRRVMNAVFKRNNAKVRCLYSGEFDAMKDEKMLEIKCVYSKYIFSPKWWTQKSIYWYLQVLFLNIGKIYVAHRSEDWKIEKTEYLKTADILKKAERQGCWSRKQCVENIVNALKFVEAVLMNEEDGKVFNFRLNGKNEIECSEERNVASFVPDSFLNKFRA